MADSNKEISKSKEVVAVRTIFRKAKYFLQVGEATSHMSLDGKIKLTGQLVEFSKRANENYEQFVNSLINDTSCKIKPVFVTEAEKIEYDKIENCTKSEIEAKVLAIIMNMEENNKKLYYDYYKKEVKQKKKDVLTEFYNYITNVMDEIEQENSSEDEEAEEDGQNE